jgi:hypothetical protein
MGYSKNLMIAQGFFDFTTDELEELRFQVDCEILNRKSFVDSFDSQIQAEETSYRHSFRQLESNEDYIEF